MSFWCLLLPHGVYSLFVASLVSMGWIASMVQDECNYAWIDVRPTSGNLITSDWGMHLLEQVPDVPYIQVGLRAYRIPYTRTINYVNGTKEWEPTMMGACVPYPSMPESGIWKMAHVTDFLAMVVGGGATFYVWISTCCRFSKPSWRWAGYEVALATFLQAISFIWFANPELCGHDFTTCKLYYGSKGDILALALWSVAAGLIFCHYPIPKELGNQNDALVVGESTTPGSSHRRKTTRTKSRKSSRRRSSRSKQGRTKVQSTDHDDTDDLDLTIESSSSSTYSESSIESPTIGTAIQEVDAEMAASSTTTTSSPRRDTSFLQNSENPFNPSSTHLDDVELI